MICRHAAILDLDKIVFNGPSKQPFYIVDLLADKRITELKYVEYNKIYRGFKTKYLEELVKICKKYIYIKFEHLLQKLQILGKIEQRPVPENAKIIMDHVLNESAGFTR